MKIPLLQIVESPEFKEHIKKKKWKTQSVLKHFVAQFAGKFTNKPVYMSKGSKIENLTHKLSRKLSSNYITFDQFQNKEKEWLLETFLEIEEETKLEEEVARSSWWKKRKSDSVFETSSSEEDDSVWAPKDDERKQEPGGRETKRRKRRMFSEVRPRMKSYLIAEELTRLAEDGGEEKERELLRRLKEKYAKIDAKKEVDDDFNLGLSCLNLMNELRLSVRSYKKLKRWCEDVLARGGDLGKLPLDSELRRLKQELVPQGLVATAKEARVGLQQTLDHTATRFAERPDFVEFLEDGATWEMLTKAGSDGQTGLGKISR